MTAPRVTSGRARGQVSRRARHRDPSEAEAEAQREQRAAPTVAHDAISPREAARSVRLPRPNTASEMATS